MAKIKMGAIVTDIRGKLGGHVFTKNRGGSAMRTKVTPSNPRTVAQMSSRAILGALSASWSGLSATNRQAWNDAVSDYTSTNVFGDGVTPSGKNLYVGLNKNLLASGLNEITVPAAKVTVPFLADFAVSGDVSANELTVSYEGDATGFKIQVASTGAISQGTSNVNGKHRVIGYLDGADSDAVSIQALYVAKFGAPVAGQKINFQIKLIASTGQAGTPQTVFASIVA